MPEADVLLENGTVITLDRASRIAEAVAVRQGRVLAVGPTEALLRHAGPATQRLNLRGRTVVPGFCDAHPHVDREGLKSRGGIPIHGLRTVDDIVEVVRQAARTVPPGEWIVLMPMGSPPHDYVSRPDQLAEGRFPNRYGLDALGERGVPLRALLDAEIPVALGTDGVPPSMLWTMWEALARWDGDSKRQLGASGLSRQEALRLCVQTGHLLTWNEHRRGVLEPGYDPDLVVLDGNPLSCPEDDIKDLAVDLTMVGGRIVYQKQAEDPGRQPGDESRQPEAGSSF